MKTLNKKLIRLSFAAAIAVTALTSVAQASDESTRSIKLLTAHFDPRNVVQVEAGDFHFKAGQIAPIHSHSAPAVGYIAKGSIIYQVEGEKEQLLREGDVFFEPVGPRILRFDNASATEEAIFIDFNLEQEGEPFIVFEQPLTEAIDRRSLPTTRLKGRGVNKVDIYSSELEAGGRFVINEASPTLGIVAEGVVLLKQQGKAQQRLVAGKSFTLPKTGSVTTVTNASSEVPAKVITFRLL